jgi:hypothetical protein
VIQFTDDQIKRAEALLGGIKDALPKAQSNAINRSLITARAEAIRIVREQYIVDASTVRKTMVIKNAGLNKPSGFISSTGSPIALSKFDISPTRPNGKKKNPVIARVKYGSSKKTIKHAFIARTSNGRIGVFIRAGKSRFPIKQLYGPSVPQMLGEKNVSKKIEEKAAETLDKRLEHEINRILEGH